MDKAKKSIRGRKMFFVFARPTDGCDYSRRRKRGVQVRVMLNPARRSGKTENAATAKKLKAAGVDVKDSNPAFDVTHEKSMVIDDRVAFVQSLNWDVKNLEGTRDYAVVTDDKREVAEVIAGFEADWKRKPYKVGDRNLLISVQRQRKRANREIYRQREENIVGAKRTLSGSGHYRAMVRARRRAA